MNLEDKLEEQEYIDLYNKGYGLYKFSPEMAELVIMGKSKAPQMNALKAGVEQSKNDYEPDLLPDWLKQDRFKENGKDMNSHTDKEIEPEKD